MNLQGSPHASSHVDDLIGLSEAHCRFEEGLLKVNGFPGTAEHRKVHRELLDQVRMMRRSLVAGGHVSHRAVARFLADWLTNHILREDMDYKPYLTP